MTLTPLQMRERLRSRLGEVVEWLNSYLRGENVAEIKDTLRRLGRSAQLPHWYSHLEAGNSMPNLDGKTIGSVIEMTLVGVLENKLFSDGEIPELTINVAKGVDIPALGLGIKSPSENYYTSEPFFSAYERVLGNVHDNLVLLTDYQTAKKQPPPVRIQIIASEYLAGSQIADKNLCKLARMHRNFTLSLGDAQAMKYLQFLCHINKQSWRASWLLKLCNLLQSDKETIAALINKAETDFNKKLKIAQKKGVPGLDDNELVVLKDILNSDNIPRAIINACNDWVIETNKDFTSLPNSNEWERYLSSPLNGRIGMSFALQWRYNFGALFAG